MEQEGITSLIIWSTLVVVALVTGIIIIVSIGMSNKNKLIREKEEVIKSLEVYKHKDINID